MTTVAADSTHVVAEKLIAFLETGQPPPGLFAGDVFCDFTMPRWRVQAAGVDDVVALRRNGHPSPGRVLRSRLDSTRSGFALEVEEAWEHDGDQWYCRELIRADVTDGAISELSVYCTGDWDSARMAEHAATVTLIRV